AAHLLALRPFPCGRRLARRPDRTRPGGGRGHDAAHSHGLGQRGQQRRPAAPPHGRRLGRVLRRGAAGSGRLPPACRAGGLPCGHQPRLRPGRPRGVGSGAAHDRDEREPGPARDHEPPGASPAGEPGPRRLLPSRAEFARALHAARRHRANAGRAHVRRAGVRPGSPARHHPGPRRHIAGAFRGYGTGVPAFGVPGRHAGGARGGYRRHRRGERGGSDRGVPRSQPDPRAVRRWRNRLRGRGDLDTAAGRL
ncbi:MAG: hypothetical protein AVDCRST_MAG89-3706, partial [uncultured Gemmatimonadetes bacterium]